MRVLVCCVVKLLDLTIPKNRSMKFFSLLILLSLSCGLTIAQNKVQGAIKGKVKDAQNNLPLEHATVTLLDRQDSVAVGYTVADKEGLFEIKNINSGAYIFGISFTGYREFVKNIDITATCCRALLLRRHPLP